MNHFSALPWVSTNLKQDLQRAEFRNEVGAQFPALTLGGPHHLNSSSMGSNILIQLITASAEGLASLTLDNFVVLTLSFLALMQRTDELQPCFQQNDQWLDTWLWSPSSGVSRNLHSQQSEARALKVARGGKACPLSCLWLIACRSPVVHAQAT